jgi:membrane-associated phospholipid phosphatase
MYRRPSAPTSPVCSSSIMFCLCEPLESRTLLAADAVLDWNSAALDAIRADKTAPPIAARDLAMMQVAVFDAVNAITGGYHGYVMHRHGPKDASAPAAVAQAAHDVLTAVFPEQAATFDAKLASSLSGQKGPGVNKGVALGRDSARAILKARKDDGSTDQVTYTVGSGPGVWQPTPPAFSTNPLLPQWPGVTPFAVPGGNTFRPPGPPALGSAEYAAALDEVKSLGAVNSTTRTPDQTEIANFWADGAGTATPPGHWNQIAADVGTARHNTLAQNARMFALLDVALADAGICCWDCKYQFNFWRPVTSIRAADTDGNPATTADPSWTPLLVTPPFPTYVSGHSTVSAAAATELADFFGTDKVHFATGDDTLPGVTRSFDSFSAAAAEAGQSRIYGGIHYQFDNQDGLALGRKVGSYVFSHVLVAERHGGHGNIALSSDKHEVAADKRDSNVRVVDLVFGSSHKRD